MRRTLISSGALVAAVAGSLILAPVASASGNGKGNGKPGDNGTVKIHDAKTGEELMKNEPHVCTFYLDGFKFDGAQKVDWTIKGWAPTKDLEGTSGSLTLDGSGHGRTADISLPDGHYKLFWNFDGEHGAAKHKTFWVDCKGTEPVDPSATPTGTPSATPSETTPGTPSGTPSETTPGTPTETAPGTPTGTPSGTPSATTPGTSASPTGTPGASETPGGTESPSTTAPAGGNGGSATPGEGDLAETGAGAPIGIIAAAALALAAAGAVLVTRRRKAQQH